MTRAEVLGIHDELHAVQGWMAPEDALVMAAITSMQRGRGVVGDVLEVGVFEGRSAIFLARLLAAGERLVVCDLFGEVAPDTTNRAENEAQYRGLTRRVFEDNCRRHLGAIPEVHQCPSDRLGDRLAEGTYRLVHLDGSHSYDVVREDIELARELLVPGGLVAFDDYRSAHTPGVAAAAWSAVVDHHLFAVCATPSKLYAAVADDDPPLAEVSPALAAFGLTVEEDRLAGRPLLRVVVPRVDGGGRKALARSLTPPALWRVAGIGANAVRRQRRRRA